MPHLPLRLHLHRPRQGPHTRDNQALQAHVPSGCLAKWLEEHATCPMCRAKLSPRKVKVWRVMCEVARVDGLGTEVLTCDEVWELGKDLDEQGEEIKRFLALKPVCVEVWEEE
jgi:hypothetical protein